MSNRFITIAAISLIAIAAIVFFAWSYVISEEGVPVSSEPPVVATSTPQPTINATPENPVVATQTLFAASIPSVDSHFEFSADIPQEWKAEAVPAIQAINIYDPAAVGSTSLEKSQIFIRYFSANQFLTLDTVTIHKQEQLSLNGRPAMRYDIEKKDSIPNFPSQPLWRNARHIVTDIRVSSANPSTFYVIAKNPALSNEIYDQFLRSLQVQAPGEASSAVVPPIREFSERITLKAFGQHITPENSPVQPERFSGYHTGVDVEFTNVTTDVPVVAIADGTVMVSRQAAGYGGVVAIRHQVNGQTVTAIYGHLDPASLPGVNTEIAAGEQIGILGEGGSAETDGERKHLHLALIKGSSIDLRGYVQNQSELSTWLDPREVIQ